MKLLRFSLRALGREARAGELAVLATALTIAVASVAAIGFVTDRVGKGVARQAAEVLAADLRLRAPHPLDRQREADAATAGLRSARTLSFPSVVYAGEQSALAAIMAVTEGYPLRGELRVAERLLDTPRVATGIPEPGEAWLDPALMAGLDVARGDSIEVGALTLRVAAVLNYRPDQSPGFTSLAATLLMNEADIAASGLITEGSRVRYAQLFAGPPEALARFADQVRATLPDSVRAEDQANAGAQLRGAIERAGRFLALASLASLLLAAVAVAMSARRYAQRRLDSAALMKALGASQRFILGTSAVQLLLVGIFASVTGSLLGRVVEWSIAWFLGDVLRDSLPAASWTPALLGAATAIILLAGFALPSLLRLGSTPPLRVLRHDLDPPPAGILLTYGAAIAALAALVYWSVRDLPLLVIVLGGAGITAAALYVAGRLLVALIGRSRGGVGVAWRYGLANVARRRGESAVQVVAFGLGLMVLLMLTIVRNDLLGSWQARLDGEAPNQFLINIQPDERADVRTRLEEAGIGPLLFEPMIRGRITAINDVPIESWSAPGERDEALNNRELNLTYRPTLSASNEIVAGEWWPADYRGEPLLSMETQAAAEMGVGIGDQIDFVIAGDAIRARVTSLRSVEWDSFEPNFFMVFSPGAFEGYPKTFISALRTQPEQRAALRSMVRAHPGISVIDIEAVLEQVRGVIDKVSLAVQVVFLLTLAAGLVVLLAAVQATLDERRYESAVLRTFGANKRTVLAGLAAEFGALGLAAGVFAAAGASVIAWLAARELFQLPYSGDPLLWFAGIAAGVLIVGSSGMLAAGSAVRTAPTVVLRQY